MATSDTFEMSCKELVELVTDYLEQGLPTAERDRFEQHLRTCPHCRIYLEQMRRTVEMLGSLPEHAVSRKAMDVLLAHFRRWR